MKNTVITLLLFCSLRADAKDELSKVAEAIVEEARLIYRCETASWYGTDVVLAAKISNFESIVGGYFSYPDGEDTRCIFYTKEVNPKVFAAVTFDSTLSISKATLRGDSRDFTEKEKVYYSIANAARKQVYSDTFYAYYQSTDYNFVPIYDKKRKQAYVLTGTAKRVVPFGNDYLITFDDKFNVKEREKLHVSFHPRSCTDTVAGDIHTHIPGKSPYITPTDIAIAVLYQKVCNNNTLVVVSEKFYSFFDVKNWSLVILTSEAVNQMNARQDKQIREK